MTNGRADHRTPGRIRQLAAVAMLAAAAGLVGIALGTEGFDQPASESSVSSPSSPTRLQEGDRRASPRESSVPPMARSAPTSLRIPAIGVDSGLMELGLQSDGSLEVPPGAVPAGWYTGAPTPGELGPAIIAGHVRWNGTPGVFEGLKDLEIDDVVDIARQDGSTAVFRVTRIQHFTKTAFPTEVVYGDIPRSGLRLITCGRLDRDTDTYEENVVVFAVLVG